LYEIQQQIKTTTKLIQTFPQEHPSNYIFSLLQINPNTLISASANSSSNPSDNTIVIWSKSISNPLYEPIQRITQKETGGGINSLVLITQKKEEEEEFASCSSPDYSIIIWRRGKGEGDKFKIKQKITNVYGVHRLLYISLTNELIYVSEVFCYPPLLQIWSPSSSSSDFVEKQKIQASSGIRSLCQINKNDTKIIEFASGHDKGQIMIWSKQINGSGYSLCKTLKPFSKSISDLISINDNGFDCLIACSQSENKIKIFKGEKEEEEVLEHKGVWRLIPISNGQFASGGINRSLNIWSPSSSLSSSSSSS
jgi:hypothetical protein